MAFLFLSLGANVMNASGQEFSGNATIFVSQLISIYTSTIGEWIRPIISIAAFVAMFSTTLTVIDAYPRTLAVGFKIAYPKINLSPRKLMFICMFIPSLFAIIVIFFTNSFKSLVDFVTISAFITAPVFAFANYRLILSKFTPKEFHPNKIMRGFSVFGIAFLTIFSLVYVFYKISTST
jgi:Mn2+/Fe2+ NRAMP family transporter